MVSYFDQRLLNFNQAFGTDPDNMFLDRSVYEQHHIHSSISFKMHKVKQFHLTTETMTKNYRQGTRGRFVDSDNAFSFMTSVK